MKNAGKSPRASVLQNPLLKKNHAHQQSRKQERKAVRHQLAKRQWDDRNAQALR